MEAVPVGAISDDHAFSFTTEANEYDFIGHLLSSGDCPEYPWDPSMLDLLSTYWSGVNQSLDNTNFYYSVTEGASGVASFPEAVTSGLDQQHPSCPTADQLIAHDVSNTPECGRGSRKYPPGGKKFPEVGSGGADQHELLIPPARHEDAFLRGIDAADSFSVMSKKRSSIQLDRKKRNVKPKKDEKLDPSINHGTESNPPAPAVLLHGQTSSSSLSGDTNASNSSLNLGSTVTALNSNGKTRASRGSATDPQSLYARRRRERINERLRILQNLVPNGTKVDISTMLEEAIQYVKFLQHQIKLLSSDELWMYAPISYNGRNIDLDLNFS